MKNGVECYKDFFPYFKALKTNCVWQKEKTVTHTLFDLWLFKHFSLVANFGKNGP